MSAGDRKGPTRPVLCAPLRLEWAALRGGPATASGGAGRAMILRRTGLGPRRARAAAASLRRAHPGARPIAVAGLGGGLRPEVHPGDIVVATAVTGTGATGTGATGSSALAPAEGESIDCPSAPLLADALRRLGLRVHLGPIVTSPGIVDGPASRGELAAAGAFAVDQESVHLLAAANGGPVAVLRVVVDTPDRPLRRPGTLARGLAALATLRRAAPALSEWAGWASCPAWAGDTAPESPHAPLTRPNEPRPEEVS